MGVFHSPPRGSGTLRMYRGHVKGSPIMAQSLLLTLHDPLTEKQKRVLKSKAEFMVLQGPAGTAKTYIALARGLMLLDKKKVDRIVIIRSPVEIRKIGFLPGDHAEKLDVYTEPYVHLIDQLSPKRNFRSFVGAGLIEFHSTSYLRGVTFDNSYVLCDEFQNLNEHEMDTVATRVGDGTHLVLCGDTPQSDLEHREAHEHEKILRVLTSMDEFDVVNFTVDDIVRSGFVKRYYRAKESLQITR